MAESNCAVMRESLLDQYMTVEASHFRDGKYAASAKAVRLDRKNFAFCDIASEHAFGITLQTVECDIPCCDVALSSSSCEIRIGSFRLKQTMLDQLIFDRSVCTHLACRSIAAVEAHKGIRQCIVKFSFNRCFPHGCRYGIVDIQKCYCIFADAGTNVLTQRAIDIDFAGNRNSGACQTAFDLAR